MIKEIRGLGLDIDLLLKTVHEKHCVKLDTIKKIERSIADLLSSNEITDSVSIENLKTLFDRFRNLEKKVGAEVVDEDEDCIAIHESIDTIKGRFLGNSMAQSSGYEVSPEEMVVRLAALDKESTVEKKYPLLVTTLNQIYKKINLSQYGKALKEAFDTSAVEIVSIPSVAKLIIIELFSTSLDENLPHHMEFFHKDRTKMETMGEKLLELHQTIKELSWIEISDIILLGEGELKLKAKEANRLMLAMIKEVGISSEDFRAIINIGMKNSLTDVKEMEDQLVENYNRLQDDLKLLAMIEKRRKHRF